MRQITIYLDDEVEFKLRIAAKTTQENHIVQWPDSVKALAGAWTDFPSTEDIRHPQVGDSYREEF